MFWGGLCKAIATLRFLQGCMIDVQPCENSQMMDGHACDMYDLVIKLVLIIIVYDMQYEDTKSHSYMGQSMIEHLEFHDVPHIQFCGSRGEIVPQPIGIQCTMICKNGYAKQPMEGMEKTCNFHYEQSVEQHM